MKLTKITVILIFFTLAAILNAGEGKTRQWKSEGGNHTINAEYLGMKGKERVYLLKKNGKVLAVKLSLLSEEDQDYIAEQESPKLKGSGLSQNDYANFKNEAITRFDEIEQFKKDEDFSLFGFDSDGPYFRWKLQVKRLKNDLGCRLSGTDIENTNAGLLADAVSEIEKLGLEYDENGGEETPSSQRKAAHIQDIFGSLTEDPSDQAEEIAQAGGSSADEEPNPFEEDSEDEWNGDRKEKHAKKEKTKSSFDEEEDLTSPKDNRGPKSRKPSLNEDNSAESDKSRKASDPLFPSITNLGDSLGGLVRNFMETPDDENGQTENFHESAITHEQFEMITGDMTKEDVFAILGPGNRVNVPFSGTLAPGVEVYVWKNDGNLDVCEVTFIDGKASHKGWSGSSSSEN